MMDWGNFAIVRCSVAQTVQSRKNHFVQWGQPLGFDESGWIARFESLESGEWAQNDRYITWALVPRDSPETIDLLAHCETFKRLSVVRSADSKVKEVASYGIASVYTPDKHRGKSYARQLLQLVHYLIAPEKLLPPFPSIWGTKPEFGPMDADFSILFSGIGDKYYASCRQGEGSSSKAGWIRQPITARTWDISAERSSAGSQEGWKWLGWDELGELEMQTAWRVKQDMEARAEPSFAVLPNWSLLRVHAARSEVSPASRNRPGRPYGLVLPATRSGEPMPFVTFTYPEGASDEPTLRITHLQHPIPFEALETAARKAGCTKVSMWGARGRWDDKSPSLDSESEVPCYVVYGRETEDYTWVEPELYTWC